MPNRVSDWSITPASNTSVDGVAIGESVPFANMNNMGRAIMAAVKLEVASIGSNVSASGTPDIGSVGGALTMLGVTTVTGFATAPAGLVRTIHFETATPVVPGANLSAQFTSVTTIKGDVMTVRSLGSGAWKVEYFSRLQGLGKHKIFIPASAVRPHTSIGPAAADTAATEVQYFTLDFDASSVELVYWQIGMPSSWDEGTITYKVVWTAASGSGNVVWGFSAVARGDDDAIAATYANNITVTDTLLTAGDVHRSPESAAITVEGSPAANDIVFFRLQRVATDGGDTLAVDARLLGIEIYITTNEAVDAA